MKIQTKLMILMCAVTLVVAAWLAYYSGYQKQQLRLILQDERVEKQAVFEKILSTRSAALEGAARQLGGWGEMLAFISQGRDTAWGQAILSPSLRAYRLSGLWVYRADGTLRYATGMTAGLPLPAEGVAKVFGRSGQCHFFVTVPLGIMEVCGRAIPSPPGPKQPAPPLGYVLAGQLWDNAFLSDLSSLIGGVVRLAPAADHAGAPAARISDGEIVFHRYLAGWDNALVATADIATRSTLVGNFSRRVRNTYIFTGLCVVLAALLLLRFLYAWINVPLRAIGTALQEQSNVPILVLLKDRSEFGEVGRTIDAFFKQREALAKETKEREQAEYSLTEQEAQYRDLVERIAEGIASTDAGGVITFANPCAHEILGVAPGGLAGRNIGEFTADSPAGASPSAAPGAADGQTNELEVLRQNDHQKRVLLVTATPRADQQGNRTGSLLVFKDITERQQMEAAIQQAQKFEAIGQLAAGISNDFKSELAEVTGNAEVLQINLASNPDLAKRAELILKAGKRATVLTKQLLSFARRAEFKPVPIDVQRVLRSVLNIVGKNLAPGIAIKQEPASGPAMVLGDPSQLGNALLAFCANAREAMPSGGTLSIATGTVTLDQESAKSRPYKIAPGQYLQVTIADSGAGISEEARKHLFEPFFTTKGAGHTGLGLAGAYGIIKSHLGAIEFEPGPVAGTIAKILLPLLINDTGTPAS